MSRISCMSGQYAGFQPKTKFSLASERQPSAFHYCRHPLPKGRSPSQIPKLFAAFGPPNSKVFAVLGGFSALLETAVREEFGLCALQLSARESRRSAGLDTKWQEAYAPTFSVIRVSPSYATCFGRIPNGSALGVERCSVSKRWIIPRLRI